MFFQGIKAVIAESYERIHRSNLIGMGIVPLQYQEGETAESLGLTGTESFSIEIPSPLTTRQLIEVKVLIWNHHFLKNNPRRPNKLELEH